MKLKEIKQLVEDYEKLYTCAVSDAIDDLGIPAGFLDPGIRPIWPGARMVGFAAIMKMVPSDAPLEKDIVARMAKFVTIMPKMPVVCVDMSGQMIAAGLGQSTCRMLQSFGFRGGLVDGPVRDIPQVIALKFPMFARGIICSSIRGRMIVDLDHINEPMKCGTRTINPNDLIFADINGAVVVPGDRVEDVLKKAKEMIATDAWWFEQLERGRNPAEIEQEKPLP